LTGINMFADPSAVIAEFRPCVLGIDTSCGGYGYMRGLPTWNLDHANLLNHMQPGNGSLNLSSPATFGCITTQANTPQADGVRPPHPVLTEPGRPPRFRGLPL
jgi:hypothetical protein